MATNRVDPSPLYSNAFEVGFNAYEFLIRCGQSYGEPPTDQWQVQIVTTPGYAKLLLLLLQKGISDYERDVGPIPEVGNTR